MFHTTLSQSVSRMNTRPFGRSTRRTSASARGMSATYSYTCVEVTASKLASPKASSVASPSLNSHGPRPSQRFFARSTITALESTPATSPRSPTIGAMSYARKPGPIPTSSRYSPTFGASSCTNRARCPTTSGVPYIRSIARAAFSSNVSPFSVNEASDRNKPL